MRKRETSDNVPWPVTPVPAIPTVSKALKTNEIFERFDNWSHELSMWLHPCRKRNALFDRRLPEVERQVRLLMRLTEEYLSGDNSRRVACATKQHLVAEQHELLARCLSCQGGEANDEQAINEFRTAIALAPMALDYWLNYVRHLIERGSLCAALDEINRLEVRRVESEAEEVATVIVNWALVYPEIGFGVRADILKHCMTLISRSKRGLLIVGNPFPRLRCGKLKRAEVLRILCSGFCGSLSTDELCRREGIDKATYYRWRRRFIRTNGGLSLCF